MKNLFDKTSIGPMKLKNRFIRGAAGDLHSNNGHPSDIDIALYKELAKGGVGTIITGFAYVTDSDNPLVGSFGIYEDSFIPEYKKLTDIVHQYDANIILQLVHYGSQLLIPEPKNRVLAPSAVEYMGSNIMPEEMTIEEIKSIQEAFADAAVRAKEAGFDGVELHGAHGFLLNQFLTPYTNRRTDEYGGPIENRARMVLETYNLVREKVGAEYPVLIKVSCTDGIDEGISMEDYKYLCRELSRLGISAIEVSGAWHNYKPKDEFYFKEYAKQAAEENDVPIILVGGNRNYEGMTSILNETSIEYFSMCRPLISEPDLINRYENGDTTKTKCISCNGCLRPDSLGACILNK